MQLKMFLNNTEINIQQDHFDFKEIAADNDQLFMICLEFKKKTIMC